MSAMLAHGRCSWHWVTTPCIPEPNSGRRFVSKALVVGEFHARHRELPVIVGNDHASTQHPRKKAQPGERGIADIRVESKRHVRHHRPGKVLARKSEVSERGGSDSAELLRRKF